MRVQIVLDEHDLLGLGEVHVAQGLEDAGVIDSRAPLGDGDMPPALERSEQHEQVGGAAALVLVVVAGRLTRLGGHGLPRLGNELL